MKPANAALAVELDPAVTAGVVDFGAQQRGLCLGAPVVGDEGAEIGIGKTVAIHHQHRIGAQIRPGEADGAGGAERFRLGHRHHGEIVIRGFVALEKIDHRLRPVSQSEHDPLGAEAPQPVQQIGQIGPAADRRQQLWRVAQSRLDASAKPAGDHQNIERREALRRLRGGMSSRDRQSTPPPPLARLGNATIKTRGKYKVNVPAPWRCAYAKLKRSGGMTMIS